MSQKVSIRLNFPILFLPFFLLLSSCAATNSLVNPKPDNLISQKRIVDLLGSFEEDCLGRDLINNPNPAKGTKIFEKFEFVLGDISRSCTFWSWRLGSFGAFDRDFITYQQHKFFISEIKKRFGVIYHSVASVDSGHCSAGKLHTMLLRDGVTSIDVVFANQDHASSLFCDKNYGQGYALRLSRLDLYDEKKVKSYSVNKFDIFNLDRLSDEEKFTVSEVWEDLSIKEKESYTKSIADRVDLIGRSHALYFEQRSEYVASVRNSERILQQKEQESSDRFNKSLANAIVDSLSKSQASSLTDGAKINSYNKPIVNSNIFKDKKGFDVSQLPENIINNRVANDRASDLGSSEGAQKSYSLQKSSASNTIAKREKSKLYEPIPTTAQGINDMWHGNKDQTLALARQKAVNKITASCRAKGARSDPISYSEIEANSPPARWSFSSPNCRQGGFNGKEWNCEVTVSGTCFRMN